MKNRTISLAICSIVVLMVVGIAMTAPPAMADEWDNWGTQFTTNPLTISAVGTVSTSETNIQPGLSDHPEYTVDRTSTWQYLSGSGTAMAMTLPVNDPSCKTAMAGDGCLDVKVAAGVTANLDIAYTLSKTFTFGANAFSILVDNYGSTSYTIEADYCAVEGMCDDPNSSNWKLGESYTVNPGPSKYYPFDINGTSNELRVKYVFVGSGDGGGGEVELCCVITPEPSSVVLLGSGALGVAGSDALGFTDFGLLGLAGVLRRKWRS